jgi:hypothetical protein
LSHTSHVVMMGWRALQINDVFSRAAAQKEAKRAQVNLLRGSSPQPRRRTIAKVDTHRRPVSLQGDVGSRRLPRVTSTGGNAPPRPATVIGTDPPVAPPRRRRKGTKSCAGSTVVSAQTSPRTSVSSSPEPIGIAAALDLGVVAALDVGAMSGNPTFDVTDRNT